MRIPRRWVFCGPIAGGFAFGVMENMLAFPLAFLENILLKECIIYLENKRNHYYKYGENRCNTKRKTANP